MTVAMPAAELWRHDNPQDTHMWKFLQHVNSKYGLKLNDYAGLFKWSVDNVAEFWAETWHFIGIKASKPFDENLLFPANAEVNESGTAVITATENDSHLTETSWAELRDQVRRCSNALRAAGVKEKSVVAGFVANHVQALVALLSAATIGAVWTGISPDNGVSAVLDRLVQIRPQVLFADNATLYNGKEWSGKAKTLEVVEEMKKHGLEQVVVIRGLKGIETGLDEIRAKGVKAEEYEAFLNSGTTGLPKAIVHTAAGTLLQHKKELYLHCTLTPTSRMLYYTTTSWMMHHWSISALSCGASLVLYSGSPFKPHGFLSLPLLLASLRVTHFGTSAAYLTTLEANATQFPPLAALDLSSLEAIYSTASPLPPSTFAWVYTAFPSRVNLASITGGTDIISLFGAPCPLLPVRVGEVQCAGLGMAVEVVDSASDSDNPLPVDPADAPGDLVCVKPFPCQPLTFFGEGGQEKYRAAYFERFPGLWHHGDFVRRVEGTQAGGGLVMLGRSDGVLKPAGVRFGSAEIYNVLTRFFAAEVEDAVCVGRRRETDRDETVCLFVVVKEGMVFEEGLKRRIAETVRRELSPRHVPGLIEEAKGGVPKTGNGKKIEVAVKQILSGMQVKTNASVANPDALDWFRGWARKANEVLPN
ncbi:hypothetical protein N0V88_001836 [Collariella sp. IMI 366227]|nr:hypothetical protein N0V88_001836 [Collariella sp. IMI 366227]